MHTFARWLTRAFAITAVGCCLGLLVSDTKWGPRLGWSTALTSAAPLLLIGVSFLVVQIIRRPRRADLMKNALLAAAFILWGIVQFMRPSAVSKRLGDVVISLYVLDLAWVIIADANSEGCGTSL
jgi:hypothetical protein